MDMICGKKNEKGSVTPSTLWQSKTRDQSQGINAEMHHDISLGSSLKVSLPSIKEFEDRGVPVCLVVLHFNFSKPFYGQKKHQPRFLLRSHVEMPQQPRLCIFDH
jgi:hypothetical protein